MQSMNTLGQTASSLALTKLIDSLAQQSKNTSPKQLLRALCSGPLHPPGMVHAAIGLLLDDSNRSHQVSGRSEWMRALSVDGAGAGLCACRAQVCCE